MVLFVVCISFTVTFKIALVSCSNVLISQFLITLSQRFIVPCFGGRYLIAVMVA